MWQQLLTDMQKGDIKALARCISFIENEQPGYEQLLESLGNKNKARIIGITGPPGAGKSTLTDALIHELVKNNKRVAVLCVDPSSPFNLGALLGDRIRMSDWYTHPDVFIRSLATRGSLGGLHPKIIEITELLKNAAYDYIIIETVGVGQSEIEIAGLADTTVVVMVPEAGDDVQSMKAGLMEIADIFVVNKSDRPDADKFVANLKMMLAPVYTNNQKEIPVIKTIANINDGISELFAAIIKHQQDANANERKAWLLTEKVFYLVQKKRMENVNKGWLLQEIEQLLEKNEFNIYRFVSSIKN